MKKETMIHLSIHRCSDYSVKVTLSTVDVEDGSLMSRIPWSSKDLPSRLAWFAQVPQDHITTRNKILNDELVDQQTD